MAGPSSIWKHPFYCACKLADKQQAVVFALVAQPLLPALSLPNGAVFFNSSGGAPPRRSLSLVGASLGPPFRRRPRHTVISSGAGRLFLPASLLRSKIPIRSESGRPAQREISLPPLF